MPVVLDGIQKVGQVGTLVGAAMESAGHHAQSQLLDVFSGDVGMKIASLIYLISILGALITLASGGNYRFAGYLLIGPPVFFFLVNTRAPSAGAEWTFGQRVHNQDLVARGTRGLTEGDGRAGDVSLFFKGWNMLTSGIVHGLIDLLHLTEKGSDVDFLNKTERYLQTVTATVSDPLLKGFVNLSAVNRCRDYFHLMAQANASDEPEIFRQGSLSVLAQHGGQNVVFRPAESPEFMRWMRTVFGDNLGQLPGNLNREDYNCDQLWSLGIAAVKAIGAERLIDTIVQSGRPEGLTVEQAKEKLLWKFGQTVGSSENIIEQQFDGADGTTALTIALNEISARMMYKELTNVKREMIIPDLSIDNPVVKLGDRRFDEGTSKALRDLQATEEYQYKGELITAALTMPYIQGVVLYFLAVLFPFFALFMIIPGRHSSLMLWMGLWLWVKLWDFGFAVVMMIDNMLYALMPHGPLMTNEVVDNPGRAFRTLLEFDPLYSAGTYYNLVACCLLAVPVVTGLVVHRGGREVMDAVTSTYREFPSKFGTSLAAYHRAIRAQHPIYKARAFEVSEQERSKWAVSMSDANMNRAYIERTALQQTKMWKQVIDPALGGNKGVFGKWSPGLSPSLANALANGYLDANITHSSTFAERLSTLDQQTFAYETSRLDYGITMSGQAGLLRWNSHDTRRGFDPIARLMLDVDNARHFYPYGGMVGGMTNSVLKGVKSR